MKIKLKILAYIIVFIGSLNWGLTALNLNIVELLLGKQIAKVIYLVVAVSALYLMFNRDTYLPFLGDTAFPCSVLSEKYPENSNYGYKIVTKPNSLVVYWAATPSMNNERSYKEAYNLYKNSGVVKSDSNGVVTLKVVKPTGYNVPTKSLKAHIHYRECLSSGMLGKVKTVYV